jgi:hypothetical protein
MRELSPSLLANAPLEAFRLLATAKRVHCRTTRDQLR